MIDHIFFYLGLASLLIHEMDAIRCKEWRIIPGLSRLNDNRGFLVFIIVHIPILYLLFWGLTGRQSNESLIHWLNFFFIIHFGLHLLFLLNKNNEFRSPTSWAIISGAGLFGLLDLLV